MRISNLSRPTLRNLTPLTLSALYWEHLKNKIRGYTVSYKFFISQENFCDTKFAFVIRFTLCGKSIPFNLKYGNFSLEIPVITLISMFMLLNLNTIKYTCSILNIFFCFLLYVSYAPSLFKLWTVLIGNSSFSTNLGYNPIIMKQCNEKLKFNQSIESLSKFFLSVVFTTFKSM